MPNFRHYSAPSRSTPETHKRGADKLSRIPIKVVSAPTKISKPKWIRARIPAGKKVSRLKKTLRANQLTTVCEEASCPNLGECFSNGTATFMIMGDICTRRCPFCDVAHGRPASLNPEEPGKLAETVNAMGLNYVVITSVDRDDLRDGGARHFVSCIQALRQNCRDIKIEILVPDFRGRLDRAIEAFEKTAPDVMNHNLETVPRLYRKVRPGADYRHSLNLLARFKQRRPDIPTKSGLMLGLGETMEEVKNVMADLLDVGCDMLTLGQYLQPSSDHLPVNRFVTPQEFKNLAAFGTQLGFCHIASGPMVRSSYHADQQAEKLLTD